MSHCDCDDHDVERIELTIIHKEAEPDVWTRLGLWPDEEDDELEEPECPPLPIPERQGIPKFRRDIFERGSF